MSPGLITCVLELTIFLPVITKDAQIGLVTFWLGQVKNAENTSIEPFSQVVKVLDCIRMIYIQVAAPCTF